MARQVYSKRFISEQGASGTGTSVTVPAGHTYVVKTVLAYSNPFVGTLKVFFQDDTSGAALLNANAGIGGDLRLVYYGAIVFEEGDGFHFQVDATGLDKADVFASGYDLINS